VIASGLIVVRHRTNLRRVLAGTEQRIGLRLMSREP
jgi:glycerol-3-phosphate acyltransferase PlsY